MNHASGDMFTGNSSRLVMVQTWFQLVHQQWAEVTHITYICKSMAFENESIFHSDLCFYVCLKLKSQFCDSLSLSCKDRYDSVCVCVCVHVCSGYFSFRHPINGSWYIQDLCETLQRWGGSQEFTELLTLVNSNVAKQSVEKCRDANALGKKQIPCFASMLTKKLYFRPKQ